MTSCPRLQALQEADINLEKEIEKISIEKKNKGNKHESISEGKLKSSAASNEVEEDVPKQEEVDMDPAVVAFYLQQAKKQKLQNKLPIKEWAELHFIAKHKREDSSRLNSYRKCKSNFKNEKKSMIGDTNYQNQHNLAEFAIRQNAYDKNYQIIRESIKNRIIALLRNDLEKNRSHFDYK